MNYIIEKDIDSKVEGNKVVMTIPAFKKEHKVLTNILKMKDGKKKRRLLKKELREQGKELKEVEESKIEKSVVHQHQSKSKTGKLYIVQEYYRKRKKIIASLEAKKYIIIERKPDGGVVLEKKKARTIRTIHLSPEGKKQIFVVKINKNDKAKKEKKPKKESARSKNPYIIKYGQYSLTRFPYPEEPEKNVTVDLKGDINSKAVLTWYDEKTKKTIRSYTREFMRRNAKKKWERMLKFKPETMQMVKEKTLTGLKKKDYIAPSCAVINIMAHTGLRIGNRGLLNETGNKGVSTLSPKEVIIDGDKISFDFTGKSYQKNLAEFRSPQMAEYLTKLKSKRKGKALLFDVEYRLINRTYRRFLGMRKKGFKLKDMRTFVANEIALDALKNDKEAPPPMPTKITAQKKAIKAKIKRVSQVVADKLNNTAGVAKSSYIHPFVLEEWLKSIGAKTEDYMKKSVDDNTKKKSFKEMSLYDILSLHPESESVNIDDDDCDEYLLPDFLYEEDEIEKANTMSHYILEKAVVHQHMRTSKSGKKFVVKEHQDKRKELEKQPTVKKMKSVVLFVIEYGDEELKPIAKDLLQDLLDFEDEFENQGSLNIKEAEKEFNGLLGRYTDLKDLRKAKYSKKIKKALTEEDSKIISDYENSHNEADSIAYPSPFTLEERLRRLLKKWKKASNKNVRRAAMQTHDDKPAPAQLIVKAVVKEHQRKSKSGTLHVVRQYSDKRQKKEKSSKEQIETDFISKEFTKKEAREEVLKVMHGKRKDKWSALYTLLRKKFGFEEVLADNIMSDSDDEYEEARYHRGGILWKRLPEKKEVNILVKNIMQYKKERDEK
jgi:DNA topoisomerase-1